MTIRLPAACAIGLLCALPAFAAPARSMAEPAGPTGIPFRLEGGYIVVDAELRPGQHLPFVFDSGLSDGNIVTTDTAKALGLRASTRLGVNDASGVRSDAALTAIARLRIGGATFRNQRFAIVPVPRDVTARPGQPPLAGFIGAPLLQDAVLCIDYRHQMLRRWPRAAFSDAGRSAIPMPLRHALPTVVATIDGQRATLIVDTGNDGAVVLYPSFAERGDFRAHHPQFAEHAGTGGAGQAFEVRTAEADSVMLGPDAEFQHVPLAVIPQGMDPDWGIDGMIGYELLSRLDPCLDSAGQRFLFNAD